MTDRLFTDCCYGTADQHGPNDPCPQVKRAIDEFNEFNAQRSALEAYARLPILATDCDFEIVRRSGVQGVRL